MPRPKPRTTVRDKQAIYYVTSLRAVRRDDVAQLLATLREGRGSEPLGDRTARDVIARWMDMGLATTEPYPGTGPYVVLPTARAAAMSHLNVPKRPSWTETPHTLTTAAVAIWYLTEAGGIWQAESIVRGALPRGAHLPDGVWLPGPETPPVAIEVERNIKARDRWAGIAGDLLERYAAVHYWVTTATGLAWERWADENLVPADRQRIRTYPLQQSGLER